VFGVQDDRLGEVPVAVVQRSEGSSLDDDGLRAFLQSRLAAFKIPADIRFEDAPLPKLATGKIDRVAIKAAYRR